MPEQRRGHDPPRSPEIRHRVLDREQRRLGVCGLVDERGLPWLGKQHREQRLIELRTQHVRTVIERLPEPWMGVVQLPRHPGILGALSREQHRELRGIRNRDGPSKRSNGGGTFRDRAQLRARQEASRTANRPVTIVHGLAIACAAGLALSLIGGAIAGVRGSSAWLVGVYHTLLPTGAPLASLDLTSRWVTLPMTAMLISALVVTVAAYFIYADE